MQLTHFLAVGIGGMIGSIARYATARAFEQQRIVSVFPFSTLAVNIVGSLLLGILYGWIMRKGGVSEEWRLFFGTGVCGGFTTFSAFAVENFALLSEKPSLSVIYMTVSVVGGIAAVAAGYHLTRVV